MAHVNPIQLQKFLKGVDYPASREALIENAKKLGADANICASLEQLPDEDFQTPAEVSQAVGKLSNENEGNASRSQGATSQRAAARRSEAEPGEHSGNEEFLAQALVDTLAEIEMCELALQKSSHDALKIFAQRMIDAHSKMGQQIEQLASRKKLPLPKDLTKEHASMLQELSRQEGTAFDRLFIEHNLREHEKDIKIFEHYAQQDLDDEIAVLAEDAADMLRAHLKTVKELSKQLNA